MSEHTWVSIGLAIEFEGHMIGIEVCTHCWPRGTR